MSDEDRYTRITLRIPKDLHSRLTGAAATSSRSMNAEIVNRLEESFDDSTAPDIEHLLATATASAVEAAVNAVLDKLETGGAPMEEVIRALQQGQNQGEDPAQRE